MAAHTTTNLSVTFGDRLRRWLREQDPLLVIAASALLLALVVGTFQNMWLNRSRPQSPVIIIATSQPTAALPTPALPTAETPALQVAAVSMLRFEGAVRAYREPRLDASIGAIEPGRAYTLTARLGTDWLQADVAQSGLLWFQVAEVMGLAKVPDMVLPAVQAPAQEPAVMVAAPGPAAAELAAQPTVAPPPTAAPALTRAPWMVLNVVTPEQGADDFAASFKAPAANPFIGCITPECREQFGQPTKGAP